jgi:hypothetical protein
MSASAMMVRLQEAKFAYRDDTGLPQSGWPTSAGQLAFGLRADDNETES